MSKFWGLTVSAGKKFKQQVPEAFCVSGAAVEPVDSGKYDDNAIQLYLQQDQGDHLLCSLSPKQAVLQVGLNVRVGTGETVGFHIKGGSSKSKVHLTGYTLPKEGNASTPQSMPFKGQQKSILVTPSHLKSEEKSKKRVSIVEADDVNKEVSESDEDDDDEDEDDEGESIESLRKKLFNGNSNGDEEDSSEDDDDDDEEDDDEDENSDSDLNEDELKELQQFKQKGKYNPATGDKMDEDDDSDLELLGDDSDEDDSEEETKGGSAKKNQNANKKANNTPNQKQQQNQNTPTPNKKNKSNSVPGTPNPKTPENQHLKLKTPSSAGHTPMKAFSKGGVLVNEVKVGNGQVAKPGKMVAVYYAGRLKSNNKMFDSNLSGQGFKFRLGKGEVIRGWDLGVEGMKVGGKRRLTIPAQLAYGKRGAPPDIPPNSTLLFDVELKQVS